MKLWARVWCLVFLTHSVDTILFLLLLLCKITVLKITTPNVNRTFFRWCDQKCFIRALTCGNSCTTAETFQLTVRNWFLISQTNDLDRLTFQPIAICKYLGWFHDLLLRSYLQHCWLEWQMSRLDYSAEWCRLVYLFLLTRSVYPLSRPFAAASATLRDAGNVDDHRNDSKWTLKGFWSRCKPSNSRRIWPTPQRVGVTA